MVSDPRNVCAGPFGTAYDAYIERERISRPIGKLIWGIDTGPFYASFQAVRKAPTGGTILDVPCGGGVALRALAPNQDVRYPPRTCARCRSKTRCRPVSLLQRSALRDGPGARGS